MIKDKLDIVLITYNRKEYLKSTLDEVFSADSPVKDFDITVLDNSSTDGSSELIQEYCDRYSNLKHIVNPKNIGGCANIAKALVEIPSKKYVWVLCDNDNYDWTVWNEIEKAISEDYDVIMTRQCDNNVSQIFYESAFLPACIYKTNVITETVAENIYNNIKMLFPHLALSAKNINDNNSFYIPSKSIVLVGKNPNQNESYTRGHNKDDLPESRQNIFWSVGYFSSLEYIKDKKIRNEIINGTRHYHKTLFDLFRTIVIKNTLYFNNYFPNLTKIFSSLNFINKIKFIFAYLSIKLSFKDYSFYDIRTKDEWSKYFKKVKEQQYINKLSKKYSGKKVLLYGAGELSQAILEGSDLSGLNIIGISDLKFEKNSISGFNNLKTIKPSEINKYDFDVILFSMLTYEKPLNVLRKNGVNQQYESLVCKTLKYPIRK